MHQTLAQVRIAAQRIVDALRHVEPKERADRGAAQVAVCEQHSVMAIGRETDGEIDRRGRLAVVLPGLKIASDRQPCSFIR